MAAKPSGLSGLTYFRCAKLGSALSLRSISALSLLKYVGTMHVNLVPQRAHSLKSSTLALQ